MDKIGIKLLLVVLLGLVMAGCSESAGSDPVSTAKTAVAADEGDNWLGLTDQQQEMIQDIRQGFCDDFKALREQYKDDRGSDEAWAAFDAVRDEVHAEIEKILTEEQRELFNAAKLTDEQREQIHAIREKYRDQFAAAREQCKNSGTRGVGCEAIRALHEQMRAEIEPLLTEVQLARFEARGDRGLGMWGRGFRGDMGKGFGQGPEGRIDRLTKQLNLTTEQQEQLREIFENARESFIGDCAGPPDQATREAHREEIAAQIKAILTPEQQELFDQLKNNRPDCDPGRRGGRSGGWRNGG